MNNLKELLANKMWFENITIHVDNDIIFNEENNFNMDPKDALIEALELLGFYVESV